MKRRAFIIAIAGMLAGWPFASGAQARSLTVVGFLRSSPAAPFANLVTSFRRGLKDEGFIDGATVTVEYRWANNHLDRLPALAKDLVRRGAAVIIGNRAAVEAVRAVSAKIPIVFVIAGDPVKSGLVASLNRPGGNITGVTFFGGGILAAKRLQMLHELVPRPASIAVLLDATYPWFEAEMPGLKVAARDLGLQVTVVKVAREGEFETAFATMVSARVGALLVGGGPMFTSRRRQLIALAARHAIPAIYDQQAYVKSGGLISYGTSFAGAYRQAGVYAGRILKGTSPSDLPVVEPSTFELAVNLSTANALGIRVPFSILARADQIIN